MSTTRSYVALDQLLRRSRIQVRRAARQVAFSAQRRHVSSTAAVKVGTGATKRMTFLEWYSAQLDANPLTTKIITGGLIAATGDVLCQAVVPEESELDVNGKAIVKANTSSSSVSFTWDPWRTLRFATVGAFWVAPAVHYWYAALTFRFLPGAATPLRTAQRVAADQFMFGPAFTSAFMSIVWFLEGRWQEDAKGTLTTLTDTMPGILLTGWKVWIPAMFINFGLVPLKYQVLYNNVLSLFWNAYLSYMSANSNSAKIENVVDSQEAATAILPLPLLPESGKAAVIVE